VFVAASVAMLRFIPYAELLFCLPVADMTVRLFMRSPQATQHWLRRASAIAIGGILLSSMIASSAIVARVRGQLQPCDGAVKQLAEHLESRSNGAAAALTIAAWPDFGPELLYRTDDRVLATPTISNPEGAMAVYDILFAADDDSARQAAWARGVDRILICRYISFASVDGVKDSLYRRLSAGQVPGWLEQLPLPAGLQPIFSLYRVRYPEAMRGLEVK